MLKSNSEYSVSTCQVFQVNPKQFSVPKSLSNPEDNIVPSFASNPNPNSVMTIAESELLIGTAIIDKRMILVA